MREGLLERQCLHESNILEGGGFGVRDVEPLIANHHNYESGIGTNGERQTRQLSTVGTARLMETKSTEHQYPF